MLVSIFKDLSYVTRIDYSLKPGSPMIPGVPAIDARPWVKAKPAVLDPNTGEVLEPATPSIPKVKARKEVPTVPAVPPSGHPDCIGCFDIPGFDDPHAQALVIKREGEELTFEIVTAEERVVELPEGVTIA